MEEETGKFRDRFLQEPLPRRLEEIAATLAHISSSARHATDADAIVRLLEQTDHFIEWTAPDSPPTLAAELNQMSVIIGMWKKSWPRARGIPQQRTLLAAQTRNWADKVGKFAQMI